MDLETKFCTVTPNISGAAKRNLPEVTREPTILRWLPDFLKLRASLLKKKDVTEITTVCDKFWRSLVST